MGSHNILAKSQVIDHGRGISTEITVFVDTTYDLFGDTMLFVGKIQYLQLIHQSIIEGSARLQGDGSIGRKFRDIIVLKAVVSGFILIIMDIITYAKILILVGSRIG